MLHSGCSWLTWRTKLRNVLFWQQEQTRWRVFCWHGNTTLKLIQIFGNGNKIFSSKSVVVKHYFIPQFLILGLDFCWLFFLVLFWQILLNYPVSKQSGLFGSVVIQSLFTLSFHSLTVFPPWCLPLLLKTAITDSSQCAN